MYDELLLFVVHVSGQENEYYFSPVWAVKTNVLYWATITPNLGMEFGLGKKVSLDISGNYNPWTFSNNKKLKHWLVQPEIRFWMCERFNGHFFGVHGHYAEYNAGGIKMFGLKDHRYEGNLYGGGISYGYQWIIGKYWNLEVTVGVGYAHLKYDKYESETCGRYIGEYKNNYFGPTKAGVTLMYFFK